ncbi:hypothetical protein [Paraflavitalea speifideaquila]|uniref:hypothetical protein n=1 Tax=Paraflavitalea speifideaquila TaxID=3076558 RepID=UPI0028E36C20|nr:hypothetical protein [Paraflavitalea speifideiaquila]
MRPFLICIACFLSSLAWASDTIFLKVHFLYGSKPLKEYSATESKWFGGILGGHVGIEADSNQILNFLPAGAFHVFKKQNNRHSIYAEHNERSFYAILGGDPDSAKKPLYTFPSLPGKSSNSTALQRPICCKHPTIMPW